jgi:hypothetical protein
MSYDGYVDAVSDIARIKRDVVTKEFVRRVSDGEYDLIDVMSMLGELPQEWVAFWLELGPEIVEAMDRARRVRSRSNIGIISNYIEQCQSDTTYESVLNKSGLIIQRIKRATRSARVFTNTQEQPLVFLIALAGGAPHDLIAEWIALDMHNELLDVLISGVPADMVLEATKNGIDSSLIRSLHV